MLKDYIKIIIFNTISSTLVIVKFQETYHPNLAMVLIYCNVFAIMLLLWQIFASLLIRYLSIFHQALLHDANDFKVRKIVRSLVFLVSFTCLMSEDLGKWQIIHNIQTLIWNWPPTGWLQFFGTLNFIYFFRITCTTKIIDSSHESTVIEDSKMV